MALKQQKGGGEAAGLRVADIAWYGAESGENADLEAVAYVDRGTLSAPCFEISSDSVNPREAYAIFELTLYGAKGGEAELKVRGTELRVVFNGGARGVNTLPVPDVPLAARNGSPPIGEEHLDQRKANPWRRRVAAENRVRAMTLYVKSPCLLLPLHRSALVHDRPSQTHTCWYCITLEIRDGKPLLTRLGVAAGPDTQEIPLVKRAKWWIFDDYLLHGASGFVLGRDLSAVGVLLERSVAIKSSAKTMSLGIPKRPEIYLKSAVELILGVEGILESASHGESVLTAYWEIRDESGAYSPRLERWFTPTSSVSDPFLNTVGPTGKVLPFLLSQVQVGDGDFAAWWKWSLAIKGAGGTPTGIEVNASMTTSTAALGFVSGWNSRVRECLNGDQSKPDLLFYFARLDPVSAIAATVIDYLSIDVLIAGPAEEQNLIDASPRFEFRSRPIDEFKFYGSAEIEFPLLENTDGGLGRFTESTIFIESSPEHKSRYPGDRNLTLHLTDEMLASSEGSGGLAVWYALADLEFTLAGRISEPADVLPPQTVTVGILPLATYPVAAGPGAICPAGFFTWKAQDVRIPVADGRPIAPSYLPLAGDVSIDEGPILVNFQDVSGASAPVAPSYIRVSGQESRRVIDLFARGSYLSDVPADVTPSLSWRKATGATSGPPVEVLYLDRLPLTVALVKSDSLWASAQNETEIANWSNGLAGAGWRLSSSSTFSLTFPPQGIGEEAEKGLAKDKIYDLEEGRRADFRFTPPTIVTLSGAELEQHFGAVPWNLRSLLEVVGSNRLVGTKMLSADLELLYGLRMKVDGVPNLRLAEVFARLGGPREALPGEPAPDYITAKGREAWREIRRKFTLESRLLHSRLAVFEVFDDRSVDVSADRTSGGLELKGSYDQPAGLKSWIRGAARRQMRTSMLTKYQHELADFDKLAGSFAWAFESRILYEMLWAVRIPNETGDDVESLDTTLSRVYFSALGGWGEGRASFRNRLTNISLKVEMGRISEMRVEQIGRIGVVWNKAKLVTVFKRQAVPSTQFGFEQDHLYGIAAVRKTDEYVEFLEPERSLPDFGRNDPLLSGPVTACGCTEHIPVDSRWGQDVVATKEVLGANGKPRAHTGDAIGWLVPLARPGWGKGTPAAAVYANGGKVHFNLRSVVYPGGVNVEVLNLEKMNFWAEALIDSSSNSDEWAFLENVDGPADPDFAEAQAREDLNPSFPSPAIPELLEAFTFDVRAAPDVRADLAGHLNTGVHVEVAPRTVTTFRRGKINDTGVPKKAAPVKPTTYASLTGKIHNTLHTVQQMLQSNAIGSIAKQKIGKNLVDKICPEDGTSVVYSNPVVQEMLHSAIVHSAERSVTDIIYAPEKFLSNSTNTLTAVVGGIEEIKALIAHGDDLQVQFGGVLNGTAAPRDVDNLLKVIQDLDKASGGPISAAVSDARRILSKGEDKITEDEKASLKQAFGSLPKAVADNFRANVDGEITKLRATWSSAAAPRFGDIDKISAAVASGKLAKTLRGNIYGKVSSSAEYVHDRLDQIQTIWGEKVFKAVGPGGDFYPEERFKEGIAEIQCNVRKLSQSAFAEWFRNNEPGLTSDLSAALTILSANDPAKRKAGDPVDLALKQLRECLDSDHGKLTAVANGLRDALTKDNPFDQHVGDLGSAIYHFVPDATKLEKDIETGVIDILPGLEGKTLKEIGDAFSKTESLQKDWAGAAGGIQSALQTFAQGLSPQDSSLPNPIDVLSKNVADNIHSALSAIAGGDQWGLGAEAKAAGLVDDCKKTIANLLESTEPDFEKAYDDIRERFASIPQKLLSQDFTPGMGAVGDNIFRIGRVWGSVPEVPTLRFSDICRPDHFSIPGLQSADIQSLVDSIKTVGYGFKPQELLGSVIAGVDVTPIKQLVDNTIGDVEKDLKLKAAGFALPFSRIEQGLTSSASDLVNSARFGVQQGVAQLRDLLPDFSGLKLEKLMGPLSVDPELAQAIKDHVVIKHSLDQAQMRASLDALVTNLVLPDPIAIFSFGPLALELHGAVLNAHVHTDVDLQGHSSTQETASIVADWTLAFGGTPVVTFVGTSLTSNNGTIHFNIDPKSMRLDGVLQSISDMFKALGEDLSDAASEARALLEQRIVSGYHFNLPPFDIGEGSPAVLNISIGAFIELALDLKEKSFSVSIGANLSRATAPFSVTYMFLGGGGWLESKASYVVYLDGSKESELEASLSLAVSALAAGTFSLGPAVRGSVMVSFSFQFTCSHSSKTGDNQLTFAVRFLIAGNVTIFGWISVSIVLELVLSYSGGEGLVGTGTLTVQIKISVFFTFSYSASVKKQISGGSSGSTALPYPGGMRYSNIAAIESNGRRRTAPRFGTAYYV